MDENQQLLQSYKDAIDASSIVTKTDLKGRITYANDNFCKISGYSKEELLGKAHSLVRHENMPTAAFKDMWETIQAKKTWNGIVENKHKNGSSYFVSAMIMPFLDEDGEIVEYISIRKDITELHALQTALEDRISEEVEKNKQKDEESINNLSLFLDSTPNPIIVLRDDNTIKFINKPFLQLISKTKEDMLDYECDFFKNLVQHGNYVHKQEDFVLHKANKIAMILESRRIIFNLFYEKVMCYVGEDLTMYTLNNITSNEYQRLRINYFNNQLQEYYMRNKVSGEKIETKTVEKIIEKETRELDDAERELLKRNHGNLAVSSQTYNAELDEYTLIEIQELDEIEGEIHNLIDELKEKSEDALHQIVIKLLKFSSVLNNLMEFKELSFSISSLADLLDKQDISALDEKTHKKMILFLENITLDLSSWRNIVFIEQSTNDIHYMDSSLFSSILQLELIFNTDQQHEEDDDDFELF